MLKPVIHQEISFWNCVWYSFSATVKYYVKSIWCYNFLNRKKASVINKLIFENIIWLSFDKRDKWKKATAVHLWNLPFYHFNWEFYWLVLKFKKMLIWFRSSSLRANFSSMLKFCESSILRFQMVSRSNIRVFGLMSSRLLGLYSLMKANLPKE